MHSVRKGRARNYNKRANQTQNATTPPPRRVTALARAFRAWKQIFLNDPICRTRVMKFGWLARSRTADFLLDGLARVIAILTICPFSASSVNKCRAGDASCCRALRYQPFIGH